ncbi:MAG TPA: FecR domain-containing protein [Bacteroidales bacterium]|nr:FecR domain-containing protein [Bacteroidales bacterium]HPT20998.1 FecR domain-containing protein [Bacteroidales bacterium]
MDNRKTFTDKEWEKIASLLSGESEGQEDLLNRFTAEDIDNTAQQWKELRNMDDEKKIDVNKAWNNVFNRIKEDGEELKAKPAGISIFRHTLLKIAAVALIILGLGATAIYLSNSGYLHKQMIAYTGDDQKNLQVDLPDGSKVFLNRNTRLSYRTKFGTKKREVKLTGEAFFEISHDSLKPFIIKTDKASVKVLGTSFNVITSNSDSAVEVYVKTGKVMLADNSGSLSLIIDPGYIGTIDSKTNEKVLNKDPNYLSWKTNLLVYDGQKLDVVFKDLKRVYNMEIIVDDPAILENKWTSPIDNQPQDTIIRLICASFNLRYVKDGNVYHLTNE